MEEFNAFIGGVSGVFKGFKASQDKGIHNVKNLQKLKEITNRNEVTFLNWADEAESEILVGYGDQLVRIYDLNTRSFIFNKYKKVGDGSICGIFKINGSLVTAVQSGVVKVWSEKGSLIEAGGPLSRMHKSPDDENIIGTGGKENDLKLWDLETGKTTFVAKNVRHDELELRVPVWVMDLAFRPQCKQVAVATRYGHVRLYDPSTPTRRPVSQVTAKDHSFTCITPAPREHQYVVGCTTGNMYLVDLRGKGLLLNKYKGFMGSVRQVACPVTGPYVVSVSLDRHFRIHHLDSKRLLVKEYMQSRLSALLLKSSFTFEDIKEEPEEPPNNVEHIDEEVDEEYEEMFEKMEVIVDKPTATKRTKPKLMSPNKKQKTITRLDNKNEGLKDIEIIDDEEAVSRKKKSTKSLKLKNKTKKLKIDPEVVDVT